MTTRHKLTGLLTCFGIAVNLYGCRSDAFGPKGIHDEAVSFVRQGPGSGFSVPVDRGIEREILRLDRSIPGIGGMYVDHGDVVVFAPSGLTHGQVVSALAREAGAMAISQKIKSQLLRGERIQVRPAAFALSQLINWQEKLMEPLSRLDDVAGVDADESVNRVRVIVTNDATAREVEHIALLAGIPGDAVITTIGPKMISLSSLRGTFRPSGAAVQIVSSGGKVCTVGYNVTAASGASGFLTAGHCTSSSAGSGTTGESIGQPLTSLPIGAVQINPVWNRTDPSCGSYTRCTLADAMFVQYSDASNLLKDVALTSYFHDYGGGGSITFRSWMRVDSAPANSFFIGEHMDKIGPTTGWTRAGISGTCVNVPFSVGRPPSVYTWIVLCADAVSGSRVGDGDSGAPVFPSDHVNAYDGWPLYIAPAGVLFGGGPMNNYDSTVPSFYCSESCTYYFSRWSNIEGELGTTFNPR